VQIWRADGIKRRQKLEIASTLAAQAETSLQDGASDFARLDAFRKARPLLDLLASIRQNEAIERRSAAALHESAEPLEKARAEKTKVEEASRAVRRRLDGARSWAEALEPPLTAWMEARTTHTFATKERDEREARRTTLHLARTAAADTLAIREAELWDAWRAFREIPARPAPLIRPLVARVCAEFLSLLDALPETTQSAPAPPALSPSALSPPEAPTQAEIQAALGAARAAVHAQDAIAQSLRDARTHLVTAEALTLERAHAAETAQNTHASVAAEAKEARAALVATEATLETARARAEPLERLHRFAEAGSALREGEPCPVCGSLEHPAPRLTDALETEYAEANAALGAAEAGRTLARTQADRLDARGGQLAAAAEAASKEHQAAATKEAEARDHWEGIARKAGVDSALSPAEVQAYQASVAAVRVFLDEEVTPATDGLERARFLAVQAREALARAEQELTGQTRAAEEGEAALLGAEARRTAAQAEVLAVWEGFADREASFAQPGGPLSAETLDANPTEPRERILRLIRGLVQEDTDQEMRLRGITRQVTALETDRTEYETRRRDAAAALDEARPRLSQGLSEQGFAGPDELEAQRLPPTEEERIDTLRRRLEKAQSSAATDLINARHELFEHEERGAAQGLLRDETTDVLEARIRAIGHRVTCAEGVRAQRQSKVAIEQDRQQTWKRKNAAYERARVEAEPWLRLRDLIGANNGENFREFAQAQNLGRLLVEANRHLEQLRDRYALRTMVDPKSGLPQLEFEIEDRWRADQRRSIKTLSGGESFLVSLALALGLSGLRTSSMPIETLLLDEGFGTLDPDTLDTALKALERLQGDGRQVGMISHVPGLNERIDRRIRVEPIGQGRSRVVVEVGTALRP
jgi:exonuclease SbcC